MRNFSIVFKNVLQYKRDIEIFAYNFDPRSVISDDIILKGFGQQVWPSDFIDKFKIYHSDVKIEIWKNNTLALAEQHRKHCEGEKCNISLYTLREMAERAGVNFTQEEFPLFL